MLEDEINRQRLPVGHRLGTKEELRKRFGVAVATANEALRILDIRGVVAARPGPGGGVFVAMPSTEQHFASLVSLGLEADAHATMAEWWEIRDALEPVICRKAARQAGSRDAKALHQILGRMRDASGDPNAFMSVHWTLHRRIAEIGDNPSLTRLYLKLIDILEPMSLDAIESDPLYDVPLNLEIHEQLVGAILDGSSRQLEAAIRRHTPTSRR